MLGRQEGWSDVLAGLARFPRLADFICQGGTCASEISDNAPGLQNCKGGGREMGKVRSTQGDNSNSSVVWVGVRCSKGGSKDA